VGDPLASSGEIELHLYDVETLVAVVAGDRAGRRWADGFPTEGDLVVSRLLLEAGGPLPTAAAPWGPLLVVDRSQGLVVGGVGFKGGPDGAGAVEIGYGIAVEQRGRGVATGAVRAAAALARQQGVRSLVADTEPDNLASQRVLAKVGFSRWEPPRRADEPAPATLWWRLELVE
jgi:RimJ/RimL family protein N-acetyltransferase